MNSSYQPDHSQASRQRSIILTIWMALYLLAAGGSLILIFANYSTFTRVISPPMLILQLVAFAGEAAGIFGIFMWKRWGVYLFIGAMIASAILRLATGIVRPQSIFSYLLAAAMLYFFVKPKWQDYE